MFVYFSIHLFILQAIYTVLACIIRFEDEDAINGEGRIQLN